jgi:surface polysaccharide O-acyltransferase-like enzyme
VLLDSENSYKNEGINLPVDLIRTIAITLVLLIHAAEEVNPAADLISPQGIQLFWSSTIYDTIARISVPLFLILSGALLLTPSKADEPLKVFFKKRWAKIGIPALFWGAAFFAWRYFVQGEVLTFDSILQGIFAGPYQQFWYIYLLVGLYLLTPLLRVLVAHADWKLIKYFLVIWFVGTGIIPLLNFYYPISAQVFWFNGTVFLITKLIGYYILGAYISRIHVRRSLLILTLILSNIATAVGTYYLAVIMGGGDFFIEFTSVNVILASISAFLLLAPISQKKLTIQFPKISKVLKVISVNTLGIFLIHYIPLEILQKGYLGVKISVTTMNPIIEIPLVTVLTLLMCLAIILPLSKIPYVKRIFG